MKSKGVKHHAADDQGSLGCGHSDAGGVVGSPFHLVMREEGTIFVSLGERGTKTE